MKIITRQILADTVLERWKKYYPEDTPLSEGRNSKKIYMKLRRLKKPRDPDMVDAVIGNESWTRKPICDICGKEREKVLELTNHCAVAMRICQNCVEESLRLLKGD